MCSAGSCLFVSGEDSIQHELPSQIWGKGRVRKETLKRGKHWTKGERGVGWTDRGETENRGERTFFVVSSFY